MMKLTSLPTLVLACASFLVAQSDVSTIRGTAQDPSQAAVPGAEVTLTDTDTGVVVRHLRTDRSGNYEIPDVKSGNYQLQAVAAGFKPFVASGIAVDPQQVRRIDIHLEIGSASQGVTVQAGAALIDAD